jgi:SAM-dependent methyltransferase
VAVLRGDVVCAPFRPGSFDVITCISTIEHVGLDIYGQGADEFGDEVAMRHMRRLLRPGGRVLLTFAFGRRAVFAWQRVYDQVSFRRLIGGYRLLSVAYYRRQGDRYLPCRPEALEDAGYDFPNMRSDGVVLAELTPAGGLPFLVARLLLRIRRTWRQLTHRGPFWTDPWSGESAAAWLKRQYEASRRQRS